MTVVMRGTVVCVLCLLCGIGRLYAQDSDALQRLLQTEGLEHAAVGIAVKSVADGKTLLEYCSETALTPASVVKLFPTWFALCEKGGDYRFQTPVYYSGEIKDGVLFGDIIIQAQGDPTLDSRYFTRNPFLKTLVSAIKSKGIRRIAGTVKVEGALAGVGVPGSWLWEDISNYYAALYLPFNYRDNLFTLQFRTGEVGKVAELVSVTPALPGIQILNEVKAAAGNRDDAWIYGGPYSSVLCVKGTVPARCEAFLVKGTMHDPAAAFVAELKAELQQDGISVDRKYPDGKGRKELMNFSSPELSKLVYYTNKSSVNLFAEALGYLVAGEAWTESVAPALERSGIDASGILLKDACGLSPMNAVPARVFTDLLVYAAQHEASVWLESLPMAGIDGGLAGYCRFFPGLKNRLSAKTGSMAGIRNLSGYLLRNNGEKLAFTILINHYTCTPTELQKAVGEFLNTFLRM